MESKTHLPRELGLEETAGGQRLASLDDIEVLGINVTVLGKVEVLLGHEHTLYKFSQSIVHIHIHLGLGLYQRDCGVSNRGRS